MHPDSQVHLSLCFSATRLTLQPQLAAQDPVSGDEVISDTFKFTEPVIDGEKYDVVWEVDCAWITKGGAANYGSPTHPHLVPAS